MPLQKCNCKIAYSAYAVSQPITAANCAADRTKQTGARQIALQIALEAEVALSKRPHFRKAKRRSLFGHFVSGIYTTRGRTSTQTPAKRDISRTDRRKGKATGLKTLIRARFILNFRLELYLGLPI